MAHSTGHTVKQQRTCIVCGTQAGKRDLLRVVRTPSGEVRLDASGKAAGRGAYVCSRECLEKAVSSKRLARPLKTKVNEEDYARIASGLDALGSSVEG